MKRSVTSLLSLFLLGSASLPAQTTLDGFANFVRQVQLPTGVTWNVEVPAAGEELSPLAIDPGGARFELHTVFESTLAGYLLDTKYVGAYVPVAELIIRSEDPNSIIPRTRADRPFQVEITTSGLLNGEDDPEASKSVKVLHHVQSYGEGGDGLDVDRTQATLIGQGFVTDNNVHTLTYTVTQVPGGNRAKVRGEERFSVFSIADYQAPESQLDSQYIQIWPVADGSIAGITPNETLRFSTPQVTLTVNDIYPEAQVYAQVYKGSPALGTTGVVVPGSARIYNESIPQDVVLVLDDWDKVIDEDGLWTMELLTSTPFGIDRLDHVSFNINRTIQVNGSVTTVE